MSFDRDIFFDNVRDSLFGGSLLQDQVNGMNAVLAAWERFRPDGDVRFLAYMLATDAHETAWTMQPIAEYGKGEGRDYGKPDPETGQTYYGRGLVQLTWRENYARADKELLTLFGVEIGMEWDAEKALRILVAAGVMFLGMEQGWFTSKTLSDYFNADKDDARNARQIINGNDKDTTIAGYHDKFLAALNTAYISAAAEAAEVPIIQIEAPAGVQLVVNGLTIDT